MLNSADIAGRVIGIYETANQRTSGWLAVLVRASLNFSRNRASFAAAGISFYSIFSFLPLLIFLFNMLNTFFDLSTINQVLQGWLSASLPPYFASIIEWIQSLVTARGSINLIGLISFLWAASGLFNALIVHISLAWGVDQVHSFVRNRITALVLVTSLATLFVFLLILLLLVKLVLGLFLEFWVGVGLRILPFLIQSLLIFLLYKVSPSTPVNSKAAFVGCIAASITIELFTAVYYWYLSQWSYYEVLYGSIGVLIGLFFWIYLSNWIVLFCAYLTEAIQARRDNQVPSRFYEPLNFTIG